MNVLITLGHPPKVLELARAFAQPGCEVTVAEPFAWDLCRISRDVQRSVLLPAPNADAAACHQALVAHLVAPVSKPWS